MSADYPDREAWLKIRNQKKMIPKPRMFHQSVTYHEYTDEDGLVHKYTVGHTYRKQDEGSNGAG